MFKITKNGNTSSSCVVDILADSTADIVNLPTKASANYRGWQYLYYSCNE